MLVQTCEVRQELSTFSLRILVDNLKERQFGTRPAYGPICHRFWMSDMCDDVVRYCAFVLKVQRRESSHCFVTRDGGQASGVPKMKLNGDGGVAENIH